MSAWIKPFSCALAIGEKGEDTFACLLLLSERALDAVLLGSVAVPFCDAVCAGVDEAKLILLSDPVASPSIPLPVMSARKVAANLVASAFLR